MNGWVGVDMDGTLACHDGGDLETIGEPIKPMVDRVTKWLSQGIEVRIVTARVSTNDPGFNAEQVKLIQEWCLANIGIALAVTCSKSLSMIELWDDRAIQVRTNEGIPVTQL